MRVSISHKRVSSAVPYILSGNSLSIAADEKVVRVAKNIADRKKVEQLEKFKKVIGQAGNDIRTSLQTLSIALNHYFKALTKEERMLLKNLINSIKKIAQELSVHGVETQKIRDSTQEFKGTQLIESRSNVGTQITFITEKSDNQKVFIDEEKTCYDSTQANIVLLDDYRPFVDTLSAFLQSKGIKKVDTYCSPDGFLKNLSKYPVDTKIFMDNDFKCHISGEGLVRRLITQGFKNLYILSGSPVKSLRSKYPEGIKFIEKGSETFMSDFIYYART